MVVRCDVRTVDIDPHPDRAWDFALPKEGAVVGVVRHDDLHSLHKQPTVDRQRAHRARVPVDHVLRPRLAEPQHPERPFHEPIRRGGSLRVVAVQAGGVVVLKVSIINKEWDTNENIQTQHYHGGLDK